MNERKNPEGIARNKYWEEMTDPEKIAALRETVVWLSRDLREAHSYIQQLAAHQHGSHGEILTVPSIGRLGMNANDCGGAPRYEYNLRTARERGAQ